MSGTLSLNGTWGLTWAEGTGLMPPEHYMGTGLRGRKLMPAAVPAPIHQVLQDAGLIEDPNLGLNSLKARWVEEQYWIYRHTFTAPPAAAGQHAWLSFERLELDAIVLLNGQEVGRHCNAHRPARFNVTGRLRPRENLLVVRLESGMRAHGDKGVLEYAGNQIDMLTKRPLLRKPQYQCGWDWNARLVNIGILGDVGLEWSSGPRLDQVALVATVTDDLKTASVQVRCFLDHAGEKPVTAKLRARIRETGAEAIATATLNPGETRMDATLKIDNPTLWWPIPHGEPHLYTVEMEVEAGGERFSVVRRAGIRRVEMDQSPHPVEGRYCTLKINNVPVFCKGGNWVPADMLYSTVTPERTRELVGLALEANFNMLRIWGGGCFADRALCDACDEAGVLIWHDFLFACAKYPGDDPAYAAEVRREVTRAVRELSPHPSLVVWCGNNEIEWGDWSWGYDNASRTHPHYALFHHDIPKIVHDEDSSKLHWISSPWSPDYREPNDPVVGDQHPWRVSILEPGGADFWNYRGFVDRFPNEGGVLGATSPATLRQCLPENQRSLLSATWDHHDNPFACTNKDPGTIGRAYHTVELWTGSDPFAMDWEQYAFASALLQAEGLSEYIANYRRRMFDSASAIFWMYNDSWPVTHGWTIVDYYLRKKLCYHPVRRAFDPVSVVVVNDGDEVVIHGVNDRREKVAAELRYGLFQLAGGLPLDETRKVTLEANASTRLARFPRSRWDSLGLRDSGAFAVLSVAGQAVAQHRLFLERFRGLRFAQPDIRLEVADGMLTAAAGAFVWGLCLDVDGERPLADNCFDLLPGIPYRCAWPAELGPPQVVKFGNRDVPLRPE